MFQKIQRDDSIFQSDLFLKDVVSFSILTSILNDKEKYPDAKIFSDGRDCAIVNSDPKHKVIAWTSDDFKEYDQLYDFLKSEFKENTPFRIMAKKAFYDYLVKNGKMEDLGKYLKENEYNGDGPIQTLGVFTCKKLNDIQYNGRPDHAKPEEVEQIAQMFAAFGIETKEDLNPKIADYIEKASKFVSDPMSLVWRNQDGKIVSTADVRMDADFPRVGKVYTVKEERGHSYAKMLVHYLTSIVLKSGKIPMLYTDFNYNASNRCYQAIGYELNCNIVNFTPPLNDQK